MTPQNVQHSFMQVIKCCFGRSRCHLGLCHSERSKNRIKQFHEKSAILDYAIADIV